MPFKIFSLQFCLVKAKRSKEKKRILFSLSALFLFHALSKKI
jgi:hypothetical protein